MNRRSFVARIGSALLGARLAGLHLWGEVEAVPREAPRILSADPVWLVERPYGDMFGMVWMDEKEMREQLSAAEAETIIASEPSAYENVGGVLADTVWCGGVYRATS